MTGAIWLRRLARFVLHTVPTVLLVITLAFFLMQLAPGDVVDFIVAETGAATEETTASLRHALGLDRGVVAQLLAYLDGLAHGSLGISPRYGRPVTELIGARLPGTLLLVLTAILLAAVIGVTFGTLMALSAGRLRDRILSVVTLLCYSLPSFWIALMLMILFSVILGWLPTGGAYSLGKRLSGIDWWLDRARYLILPALSLALYYVAIYARLTRASVLEMRRQDYVRTALAKGLTEGQVARRHVLRNALIPVTTMAGMHIGAILGGAVVIETVFAWPGMGRLTYEAILSRDYTLLLGILLVSSLIVVAANLVVDLVHGLLDPRIGARG